MKTNISKYLNLKFSILVTFILFVLFICWFAFVKDNYKIKIAKMDSKVKTEIEKGFGKGYTIIMGEKVNFNWENMSGLRISNLMNESNYYTNFDRYDRKNEISYKDITVYDTLYNYYNDVVSSYYPYAFTHSGYDRDSLDKKYECYKNYLETLKAHKDKKEYQVILKRNVYYCQKFEAVINDKLSYFGKVFVLFTDDKVDKSTLDDIKNQYEEFLKVKSSDCN